MSPSTILFADRCVLGSGSELRVGPARIQVDGNTISDVQEVSREVWQQRPAPHAVDLGNRLVSPAFINCHTHLSMASFRGLGGVAALRGNVVEELYYRLESGLPPESIRAFARLGAYESLLNGVGLVWDHYYGGNAVAEALRDVGLSGVVAPTLQDLAGPGQSQHEAQLSATAAIDDDASFHDAGIVAALGPHATDTVSETLFGSVRRMAEDRQLPIHVHVAQTYDEYQRSAERHGVSPLAWLQRNGILDAPVRMLLAHAIFMDEDDWSRLDPQRHVLGYCPFSQMQFCFPADATAWTRRGLSWAIATDCVPSNDSMNVQKELRMVAGLPSLATSNSPAYAQFIQTGTNAGAVQDDRGRRFAAHEQVADPGFLLSRVWSVPGALHPKLTAGALAPGQRANLVVWDPSHPSFWPADDPLRALAMSDTSGAIDGMMLNGDWVGERGNFHRSLLDDDQYRDAHDEAERRLREHLSQHGIG